MDSDSFLDEEYENLNDAILRAIVTSKEVQDILGRLEKEGNVNDKAVLNLFLSLDELYQMINEKTTKPETYKLEPETSKASQEQSGTLADKTAIKDNDIIDGKILTLNEKLFQKFSQGKFNEEDWMKKARVRF